MEIAFLEIIISGSDKIARFQGGMAFPPQSVLVFIFPISLFLSYCVFSFALKYCKQHVVSLVYFVCKSVGWWLQGVNI